MNKYRVIEIRKTEKGEEFAVETVYNAESMAHLKKLLDENPRLYVDKNYRIKEIKE